MIIRMYEWVRLNHARPCVCAQRDILGLAGPLYALRWFTPAYEVDLCGHATLAAAHALWEDKKRVDPSQPIRFSTRVGILTCRRNASEGWIEMDFPAAVSQSGMCIYACTV